MSSKVESCTQSSYLSNLYLCDFLTWLLVHFFCLSFSFRLLNVVTQTSLSLAILSSSFIIISACILLFWAWFSYIEAFSPSTSSYTIPETSGNSTSSSTVFSLFSSSSLVSLCTSLWLVTLVDEWTWVESLINVLLVLLAEIFTSLWLITALLVLGIASILSVAGTWGCL